MLDDGNDVRSVATACALGVVGMDGTAFNCCDSLLDEAGFIECIAMDLALDIVLVTYSVSS
jgi:hypothetical protein